MTECKIGDSYFSLMTVLFTDVLVFIEKLPTNKANKEAERYALKPLKFKLKEKNSVFTPVLSIDIIHSFNEFDPFTRKFYLVASMPSECHMNDLCESPNNKFLLIFTTKEESHQNEWISRLYSLIPEKKIHKK